MEGGVKEESQEKSQKRRETVSGQKRLLNALQREMETTPKKIHNREAENSEEGDNFRKREAGKGVKARSRRPKGD